MKLLGERLILGLGIISIDILVNGVEELLHELVGVFLFPVDEKHAYFSYMSG